MDISYAPGVPVDAIVALGCRVEASGALSAPAARRVERAVRAYHAGVAPYVVVSGGKRWQGMPESSAYRAALLRAGVPEANVLCEDVSCSTLENARYTGQLFAQRGWRHAAVVTCDWHLARAEHCFKSVGLLCTGLAAPSPPVPTLAGVARSLKERGALLLVWVGARRS